MTRLRFYAISQELNAKSAKEDEYGEGWLCDNRECKDYLHNYSILELIDSKCHINSNRKDRSDEAHFICERCEQPLKSASQLYSTDQSSINLKKQFNQKLRPITLLLDNVEKTVAEERRM